MRSRINRLVYVLLGAVLAVGLLVSALVRPEPKLAASEDCYGLCASVTVLSLSSSTIIYGYEQVERFSARVTAAAPGTGAPTGYVVVESGTKILCSIRLYRGTGSCSPAARALARGSYKIVAHYGGNMNFKPSTSNQRTLTVLRYSSPRNPFVTLSLSRSTVTYGNEQVERFSVKVTGGAPVTSVPTGFVIGPTGSVVVESGTKTLCVIYYLYRGTGSCSATAKALAPGSYEVIAHYAGALNSKPSTSSWRTLNVLGY
jgi:hypothetical protein